MAGNSQYDFTVRPYTSAVYVLSSCVCPSVCLSMRPSQVRVLSKLPNTGSRRQRRTIAQGLYSSLMQKTAGNSNEINGGA